MQAMRYHLWQDPDPSLSGRESRCEQAAKLARRTGVLPAGLSAERWKRECEPVLNTAVANSSAAGGGAANGTRQQQRQQQQVERQRKLRKSSSLWREYPPRSRASGNGGPGQYTRWAGVG